MTQISNTEITALMDAIDATVKANLGWVDGTPPVVVTPPVVDPPPVVVPPIVIPTQPPAVTPATLTAAAGDGKITAVWAGASDRTLLSVVIGRGGVDTGGAGAWSTEDPWPNTKSRVFDKLVNDTQYLITATFKYATGPNTLLTARATPVAPVVSPPIGGAGGGGVLIPGKAVLTGRGQRAINVLFFNEGDTNDGAVNGLASQYLGMPKADGGLTFLVPRDSGWAAMQNDSQAADAKAILDAGGIVVWSIPIAPFGDANMNTLGAANAAYKAGQTAFGAWLVAKGLNRPGMNLRPGWEFNGGWYPWTAGGPGGIAALKLAFKYLIDNVKAGGAKAVGWDLCSNMASQASGVTWADLWLGAGYWTNFGIDRYDGWPAIRTAADWEGAQQDVHSVRGCAAQAFLFGVTFSIDEFGPIHQDYAGYDNPFYITAIIGEVKRAGVGHCAWISYFNSNGAPADLFHRLSDNPLVAARLKLELAALPKAV